MLNASQLFLLLKVLMVATLVAVAVAVAYSYVDRRRRAAHRTLRTALRTALLGWLKAPAGTAVPPLVRRAARRRWHTAVLIDALSSLTAVLDDGERDRVAAMGDELRLTHFLRKGLRARDPFARAGAVESVGLIEARSLLDEVSDAMRDHSGEVRMAAAAAYARLRGIDAVPALLRMTRQENGPVAQRAAELVASFGGLAAPAILGQMDDPTPLLVRLCASGVGPVEAQPALIGALRSFQPPVRLAAARALGDVGSTWTVAALVDAALADPDTYVRSAAATALGQIGDASAVGALLALIDDPDHVVRSRAAGAIADLGAVDVIERLATSPDPDVALAARVALQTHLVQGGLRGLVSGNSSRRVSTANAVRTLIDAGYHGLAVESRDRHPDHALRAALGDILTADSLEPVDPPDDDVAVASHGAAAIAVVDGSYQLVSNQAQRGRRDRRS
jgi:HEAT repeat protein